MTAKDKIEDGFARTYGLELLFAEKPKLDIRAIEIEIKTHLGNIAFNSLGSGSYSIFLLNHQIEYEDKKKAPSQINIFSTDTKIEIKRFQELIQQSWQTENAGEIIQNAKYCVLVTDLMSSGLEPMQRQTNLSTALKIILKHSNCIGLASKITQQIISASDYLTSDDPLFGFINIRFFNTGEGENLMDSLGLAALGLYDIQCHYKGLDPNEVTKVLYKTAYYIFNESPNFENGHTVAGVNNKPWRVQFEDSLVPPNRLVLDFHPGELYVVGERN